MAVTPLPKYSAKHVYVGDQRHYDINGAHMPGVTTILGATSEKEALEKWFKKHTGDPFRYVNKRDDRMQLCIPNHPRVERELREIGIDYDDSKGLWLLKSEDRKDVESILFYHFGDVKDLAKAMSARSRDRGTGMHALIEATIEGRVPPEDELTELAQPYYESIVKFLTGVQDVMLIEGAVSHPGGWAGSIDCIGHVRWPMTGELVPAVLDWKTSERLKEYRYITDYRLQVAAYVAAANRVYKEHGFVVRHAVIVIAIPEKEPQAFYLGPEELRTELAEFRNRVAQYKALHSTEERNDHE